MTTFEFSESATVPAPPDRVYSVIADYVNGHPHIVPKKYFSNMRVEKGGYGAGTLVQFDMRVLGRTRTMRADISEPEPGRVLVETDSENGVTTTFIVEPEPAANRSRVTFRTKMSVPGLSGWLQKWLVPRLLRPIYQEELRILGDFSQNYRRGN